MADSRKLEQKKKNLTRKENFDIYFFVIFD